MNVWKVSSHRRLLPEDGAGPLHIKDRQGFEGIADVIYDTLVSDALRDCVADAV